MEDFRDSLPSEAENYEVYCERCQRRHPHFTFTRERYEAMVKTAARRLAEHIDAEATLAALIAMQDEDQ